MELSDERIISALEGNGDMQTGHEVPRDEAGWLELYKRAFPHGQAYSPCKTGVEARGRLERMASDAIWYNRQRKPPRFY